MLSAVIIVILSLSAAPNTVSAYHIESSGAALTQSYAIYEVTAYTAGEESTGKTPDDPAYGITASGARVESGRTIACDPKKLPFGTRVYIEEVGVRVCEDTGGTIRGNRIDVYIPDLTEALAFGRRELAVLIIESYEEESV